MSTEPDPVEPRAFTGHDDPAALAHIDQLWSRAADQLRRGQVVAFQLVALRRDTGKIESTALAREECHPDLVARLFLEAGAQSRVHFEAVVEEMRGRGFELDVPPDGLPWRP